MGLRWISYFMMNIVKIAHKTCRCNPLVRNIYSATRMLSPHLSVRIRERIGYKQWAIRAIQEHYRPAETTNSTVNQSCNESIHDIRPGATVDEALLQCILGE